MLEAHENLPAGSKKFACVGGLLGFRITRVFHIWRVPSLDNVTSTRKVGSQATEVNGWEPTCVLKFKADSEVKTAKLRERPMVSSIIKL